MTVIPNCFTCPSFQPMSNFDERSYCNKIGHEELTTSDVCLICKIGCLSHPHAREWLMKDVIEELEINFENDRGIDYENTISLIRNGVKKE